MANYEQTTAAINSQIKTNGNREISGQILQNVLNAIVNNLKQGYLLVGIATPDGNPGTPDQNVCWLATKGTYVNYGNITVGNGKLAVIKYNGTWTSDTVDVQGAIKSGDGIDVDPESGEVSVKVGDGLQISGGKVAAKVGDGMQIADGSIAANVGDGLQIVGGKVAANTGNGIKIEDGKVAIDLIAGSYINIENGNKINCTLDANPFYVVDELPDAPPEGLNNKLWLVPVSGQPAVDLYKWNEETSQFDKVGTITLDVNTALFIKKGKNDITEPLELDSSIESTKPETEQEVLTVKASDSPGMFFKSLTEDTEEGGVDYIVIKAMMSKGNLANRRYIGLGIVKKDGSYELLQFNKDGVLSLVSSVGVPKSATVAMFGFIVADASHPFFNSEFDITFTYSGVFALVDYAFNHNYRIYIADDTIISYVTDIYKESDSSYNFRYGRGKTVMTAKIESDDNVTVNSFYGYTKRFVCESYGVTSWYNANGTNQQLYKDLRGLIAGENNNEGLLGILCDKNNTFTISSINYGENGLLKVSFIESNTFIIRVLQISSNGDYATLNSPLTLKLFADDYNISSMPIPVKWPIASGTDVKLYNDIKSAYDKGAQVILIEGSEANKGINEYAVSEIRNIGTGRYNVYFSLQGYKYCIVVRSDGTIATTSNLIEVGITSLSLTQNIAAVFAQPLFQKLANAVAAFLSGDLYLIDTNSRIYKVLTISLPQGAGAQAYTMLYISYFNQGADPATVVLRSMYVQYANKAYSGKIVKAEFTDGI